VSGGLADKTGLLHTLWCSLLPSAERTPNHAKLKFGGTFTIRKHSESANLRQGWATTFTTRRHGSVLAFLANRQ